MFRPFDKYDTFYYLGLIFMLFPIVGVFVMGFPLWTLPLSFLFILAYLLIIHIKNHYQTIIAILWFYLLAYVFGMSTFITGNMIWFFFLTNLLIWRFGDKLLSYRFVSFLIALVLSTLVSIYRTTDTPSRIFFLLIPIFILAMYYTQYQNQIEEQMKEELYRQNETINLLAAENERNRIGRDLHDTLGHTFAMMTLKTELALKQLDKDKREAVRKELEDLRAISQTSMKEVRQLINNLTYRTVSEEVTAITGLLNLSNIEVTVDKECDTDQLSPVIQSSIIMILRELATNIIKHASATSCQISISRNQGFQIDVRDNGKGFEKLTGQELHSISERLQFVTGTVSILSSKHPTHIRVTLEDKEGF